MSKENDDGEQWDNNSTTRGGRGQAGAGTDTRHSSLLTIAEGSDNGAGGGERDRNIKTTNRKGSGCGRREKRVADCSR
jgi:hypothetical protein